jgi:hypothetical protein
LYVKTKELDKAIKEFKSCIQKNEEFGSAYVFLAKAYMDTGRDLSSGHTVLWDTDHQLQRLSSSVL